MGAASFFVVLFFESQKRYSAPKFREQEGVSSGNGGCIPDEI